jgi:hypothetical protein
MDKEFPKSIPTPVNTTSNLNVKNIPDSNLPYIRVYDKSRNDQHTRRTAAPSMKYTSIIDVSSNREKLYSASYPTVIKVPKSITRVVVGSISPTGTPSTLLLTRPLSKRGYSRSSNSISNSIDYPITVDSSQPLIPFLQMTNALQLYLKLKVLDDNERIILWTPGSWLIQKSPFIIPDKVDLNHPGYFLLTNKCIYIAKPLFRLDRLNTVLQDEQTSYLDPTLLIEFVERVELLNMSRIDVGMLVRVNYKKSSSKSSIKLKKLDKAQRAR